MEAADGQQMPQSRSIEDFSQFGINSLPFSQYERAKKNGVFMIEGFFEECSDRRLQPFNQPLEKWKFPQSHGNNVSPVVHGGGTCEARKCHGFFVVVVPGILETLEGSEACGKTDFLPGLQWNCVSVHGDNDVLV